MRCFVFMFRFLPVRNECVLTSESGAEVGERYEV